MKKPKTEPITFRLPIEVIEWLEDKAKAYKIARATAGATILNHVMMAEKQLKEKEAA